jgi:hypothetical protein
MSIPEANIFMNRVLQQQAHENRERAKRHLVLGRNALPESERSRYRLLAEEEQQMAERLDELAKVFGDLAM